MPARLRDVVRAFKEAGGEVETPNRGSHWKFRLEGRCYPVPAHNGLKSEIGDHYIKKLCETFSLDLDEFKAAL